MSYLPTSMRAGNLWDIVEGMDSALDRRRYGWPFGAGAQEGLWHPTMDIVNRNGEILVELELPGLKEKDVNVSVEEDHLVVEGARNRSAEYKEEDGYYSERTYGGFHRVVHLPASVDADNVKATFRDGLLVVRLPKRVRQGGKRIEVKAS